MRYVELTQSERITLEEGYKNHVKFHVRKRCKASLLSDEGWQVKQIAKLHHIRSRTIYTWMNRWQTIGLAGVMILPGRGVKPKLSVQDQVMVEKVKKSDKTSPKFKDNGVSTQRRAWF